MIRVTDAAAAKLKEMASSTSNPDAQMLRISFAGYG
jgi:Fe-S cluster assembly iron-binding protein IscA